MDKLPKLPLDVWIDWIVDRLTTFEGFFNGVTNVIGGIVGGIQWVFDLIPEWLFIILLLAIIFLSSVYVCAFPNISKSCPIN